MKINPIGKIQKAVREAIELRKGLIADGCTEAEAERITGAGLKAVLGNPRPDAWKFLCRQCRDTGWVDVQPSPQEMERLVRLYGPHPQYQGYVERCSPECPYILKDRKERRTRLREEALDDVESAGVRKRRSVRY